MNDIIKLHREAMELAENAFSAKHAFELERAKELFEKAFRLESKAAHLAAKDKSPEPTLSVLHRSAATLAIECGHFREAEKLISFALAGDPPNEIVDELRDLLEVVNFSRYLELRGIELEPDEFQFSIGGEVVSLGMAAMDILVDKFKYIKRLIFNTTGRMIGKAFSEISKLNLELYISMPRSGSFSISFKLGRPKQQPLLPTIEYEGAKVINELIECLELINKQDDQTLKERIPDTDYFADFVASAYEITPDGEKIKIVGLTTTQDGYEKRVALTHPIKKPIIKVDKKEEYVKISGKIQLDKVTVVDEFGNQHKLIVSEDKKKDIAKSITGDTVIVTGLKTKKGIQIEDIKSSDLENFYILPSLPLLPDK